MEGGSGQVATGAVQAHVCSPGPGQPLSSSQRLSRTSSARDFKVPPAFPPKSLPGRGSVRLCPPSLHAGLPRGGQRGQAVEPADPSSLGGLHWGSMWGKMFPGGGVDHQLRCGPLGDLLVTPCPRGPDNPGPAAYVLEAGTLMPCLCPFCSPVGRGGGEGTDRGAVGPDTPGSPCLRRSLVLNRLRPAAGGGKGQASSPRWRSRGFRCIGGVLYKVSANKLSKTCGRPGGDSGNRLLLRTGEAPVGGFTPRLCVHHERGLGLWGTEVGGPGRVIASQTGLSQARRSWYRSVLLGPLRLFLLELTRRPEQWGPHGVGIHGFHVPGEAPEHTASCLAEQALSFHVSLLDEGDGPGLVSTALAAEHLGPWRP